MRATFFLVLASLLALSNANVWGISKIYKETSCQNLLFAYANFGSFCLSIPCIAGGSTDCSDTVPEFPNTNVWTRYTDSKCKKGTETEIVALNGDCTSFLGNSYRIYKKSGKCLYEEYSSTDCSGNAIDSNSTRNGACEDGVRVTCDGASIAISFVLVAALVLFSTIWM
eukprot:TRINITY_DN52_c0_g1_i2.p2 TRINITY_DN52_c0_g1~~TRINITY_DN52_c0_g1_i2.p2  ORF type:complete len:169 (-),score=5.92 TRINITY_DN52_c0_g1_i2:37-543(-)